MVQEYEYNHTEHIVEGQCTYCHGTGHNKVKVLYVSREMFDTFSLLNERREPKVHWVFLMIFLAFLGIVASNYVPKDFNKGLLGIPMILYALYNTIGVARGFNGYFEFREKHNITPGTRVICRRTGATIQA